MKRLFFLSSLLVLIILLPVGADELLVEYVDGALEIKSGGRWEELDIGDTVPEDATIRLAANGFAELSSGSVTVTLNKPGTYSAATLLESGKQVSAFNVAKVVNSKLKKLMSPDQEQEASAMGVRAAEAEDEEMTWVEEGAEYLEEGKELLLEEEYREAIEVLLEGADFAFTDEEMWEYYYYAAYAYSRLGGSAQALKLLSDMDPDFSTPIFTDFVLLKGQLLIESLSFEDALGLFDEYLRNPDRGETTKVVHFLAAVCHEALGDTREAVKMLEAAYAIDRTSEYGRAAGEMIEKLR